MPRLLKFHKTLILFHRNQLNSFGIILQTNKQTHNLLGGGTLLKWVLHTYNIQLCVGSEQKQS